MYTLNTRREKDNIKIDLTQIGYKNRKRMEMCQNRFQQLVLMLAVIGTLGSVTTWSF
jgi:hypothetical protein